MQWRNAKHGFGWISLILHWGLAVAVIGMFCLGLWMTSLDYYHSWYNQGPDLHRSIGIIIVALFVLRYLWWMVNPRPQIIQQHKPWEKRAAAVTQFSFYVLLIALGISGYLISTADGRGLEVFNWFELPATLVGVDNLEDDAGVIHLYLAWTLILMAVFHAAAALKHHLLDRDETLQRMTRVNNNTPINR